MKLHELFRTRGLEYYPTDKDTRHSYLEVYNELFQKYRKNVTLIEIGVWSGGSLRLFSDWFYSGRIIGYDIADEYISVPTGRGEVIIKDCNLFTDDEFKDFPPDIIIDDGSHILEEQLHVVKIGYPQLKTGGLLIVEDIQNIENDRLYFNSLGFPYLIYDMRGVYDNILLVFQK